MEELCADVAFQPLQLPNERGLVAGLRRSVVMSVSSEVDPEGGEGSAWVAGVAAQGGSEVDRPRPAEHADHQVAQDRHDVWCGTGADLGGVLAEGDVADVVQRLDRPVPAQQVSKPGRAGPGAG